MYNITIICCSLSQRSTVDWYTICSQNISSFYLFLHSLQEGHLAKTLRQSPYSIWIDWQPFAMI